MSERDRHVSEMSSVSESTAFIMSTGMGGTGRVARRRLLQMRPQFQSRYLRENTLTNLGLNRWIILN
jgi:hypothetical protein